MQHPLNTLIVIYIRNALCVIDYLHSWVVILQARPIEKILSFSPWLILRQLKDAFQDLNRKICLLIAIILSIIFASNKHALKMSYKSILDIVYLFFRLKYITKCLMQYKFFTFLYQFHFKIVVFFVLLLKVKIRFS